MSSKINRREFDFKVIEFKRNLIRELLNQCTKEEQAFFDFMYKSIEDIQEDKMSQAYSQCQATLKKNKECGELK